MRKKNAVLPLSLPTIAALTPSNFDIRIIDEEMETISFDNLPDIVGITALIPNVKRAYEIADTYRAKGVPVVMGGPQVTFNIEESLTHADCVVAGEAEGVWQQCLRDFEQKKMLKVYKSENRPEFRYSPQPRWDLVDTKNIMALGVQFSRGCPYQCDFCLVRNMFGREHRYRAVEDVISEIKALPKKQITFVDDNLTANKQLARELMKQLIPLKVSWMCQSSIDVAKDEELLNLMAQAGCTAMLIGFESVNPESLLETNKLQNKVQFYEEAIQKIHKAGIHVIGSFIVGFEADRLDAFDHIRNFTFKNNISLVMLNVLCGYPGTDLYKRMEAENRLSVVDPDLLNGIYPTLQYRRISQTDMFLKYFSTLEKILSPEEALKKGYAVLRNGSFHRFNMGDVRQSDKFFSLLYLSRVFLFTKDLAKWRLFLKMLSLAIMRKANIGAIVQFLMFMASFYGYLDFTKEHRKLILEKIRNNDPGPLEP